MKKSLFILSFIFFLLFAFSFSDKNESIESKTVYVCGKSKIYHTSKYHSALTKRCKSDIYSLTETSAKRAGKRACKCRD